MEETELLPSRDHQRKWSRHGDLGWHLNETEARWKATDVPNSDTAHRRLQLSPPPRSPCCSAIATCIECRDASTVRRDFQLQLARRSKVAIHRCINARPFRRPCMCWPGKLSVQCLALAYPSRPMFGVRSPMCFPSGTPIELPYL